MNYIPANTGSQYVSGVYIIESKCGKVYVGSAVCLRRRFGTHQWNLERGNHVNTIIQNHHNKYGNDSLQFKVIELCEKGKLLSREQYYIDSLNPVFNIVKIAGSIFGMKMSEVTKLKMSNARKNALLNPLLIEKIRIASTGRKQTEFCKQKLSLLKKGVKRPQYNGGDNPKAKVCINIETGEIISNATELARILGYCRQHITNQLSGRRKNNTEWRYAS